jgi:AmmeMemoRadiSam system protein A
MTDPRGPTLLRLARAAIDAALGGASTTPATTTPATTTPATTPPTTSTVVDTTDPFLDRPGACFVSLHRHGALRGCIGNITPLPSLREAVTHNAVAAALRDPRFPALTRAEFADTTIDISVLSSLTPLPAHSEAALLAALRPGVDGLQITAGHRRAVFIPAVWEQLPQPRAFLDHLRAKAGMSTHTWPHDMHAERFTAEHFGEA